jgi:dienelactone hydrolase
MAGSRWRLGAIAGACGLALAAAPFAQADGGVGAAARGTRYLDEVFDEITTTHQDVVYGQSVDCVGQLQQHELDVHEPAGDDTELRAAVVWVHGGYFLYGSKEDYEAEWSQFARSGYVTIAINYRLCPTIPEGLGPTLTQLEIKEYIDVVHDAQHDAQAAIRWVRANAAELRIDPERIAIAGHSAGGLTTNMVAFNDHDPGNSGNAGYSSRVAAAIASAGGSLPIAMVRIGPGEPPFLVAHGLLDTVVPYVAAVPSCVVTIALLNVCEQVIDPNQDHGTFGYEYWRAFLYRHMIKRPPLQLPTTLTVTGVG